jgi:hypothetical protein
MYDEIKYREEFIGLTPTHWPEDIKLGITERPTFRCFFTYHDTTVDIRIWGGIGATDMGKTRALKVLIEEGLMGFLDMREFCDTLGMEIDDEHSTMAWAGCRLMMKKAIQLLNLNQQEFMDFANSLEAHTRKEDSHETDQHDGE